MEKTQRVLLNVKIIDLINTLEVALGKNNMAAVKERKGTKKKTRNEKKQDSESMNCRLIIR